VHPAAGKSGDRIASEPGTTDHESDLMLSPPSIARIGSFVNLTDPSDHLNRPHRSCQSSVTPRFILVAALLFDISLVLLWVFCRGSAGAGAMPCQGRSGTCATASMTHLRSNELPDPPRRLSYKAEVSGLWHSRSSHKVGRQSEAQKAFERFVTGIGRRPVPQDRKVRVTIQTYRKRQADRDKEYTAWKPCIDALRLLGWIRDDSPKWIYEDIKDPLVDKTPRSEIVIEEVS